jgi:hypothetical protein
MVRRCEHAIGASENHFTIVPDLWTLPPPQRAVDSTRPSCSLVPMVVQYTF